MYLCREITNICLILAQSVPRWPNIRIAWGQRYVSDGNELIKARPTVVTMAPHLTDVGPHFPVCETFLFTRGDGWLLRSISNAKNSQVVAMQAIYFLLQKPEGIESLSIHHMSCMSYIGETLLVLKLSYNK